jgi:hypothetical protein
MKKDALLISEKRPIVENCPRTPTLKGYSR